MKTLELESFGPIEEAKLTFGDLTILVGPQASGKSLTVQLVKAIEDAGAIRKTLKQHGFEWLKGESPLKDYLSLYFGGGMTSVVNAETQIAVDGKQLDFLKKVVKPRGRLNTDHSVFLIPAQRVLTLHDGWPHPFMSFSVGDPYCLRTFSDDLRRQMDRGLGSGKAIFPQKGRLKEELRRLIDTGIYVGGSVKLETQGMRKCVVLQPHPGGPSLPFNAWSAGQREFTPLLLGLYWLMPPTRVLKKEHVTTVIIEEPEMGLHPQAIMSFCLLALELLHRGYKVVISTHSPVVLDVVSALRELKAVQKKMALQALKSIFAIRRLGPPIASVLESSLKKDYRVYAFDRTDEKVTVKDISSLDPGSDDELISGWGGLSGFSGRVADVVGAALMKAEAT